MLPFILAYHLFSTPSAHKKTNEVLLCSKDATSDLGLSWSRPCGKLRNTLAAKLPHSRVFVTSSDYVICGRSLCHLAVASLDSRLKTPRWGSLNSIPLFSDSDQTVWKFVECACTAGMACVLSYSHNIWHKSLKTWLQTFEKFCLTWKKPHIQISRKNSWNLLLQNER